MYHSNDGEYKGYCVFESCLLKVARERTIKPTGERTSGEVFAMILLDTVHQWSVRVYVSWNLDQSGRKCTRLSLRETGRGRQSYGALSGTQPEEKRGQQRETT